jgi:hypothetical protein
MQIREVIKLKSVHFGKLKQHSAEVFHAGKEIKTSGVQLFIYGSQSLGTMTHIYDPLAM